MFDEDVTQYCPMCQEWAEKYEKLKKELEFKEKQAEDFMINSGRMLEKLQQENSKLKQELYEKNNKRDE